MSSSLDWLLSAEEMRKYGEVKSVETINATLSDIQEKIKKAAAQKMLMCAWIPGGTVSMCIRASVIEVLRKKGYSVKEQGYTSYIIEW